MLADALRRLDGAGITVLDVGLRRPTLDDVFLSLTGHAAEELADQPPSKRRGDDEPPTDIELNRTVEEIQR